jgi:hypothetical protein
MVTLEGLIRFGGVAHFGILTASAMVPKVLDWRGSLQNLPKLTRQLVCVWAIFIVVVIIGFGTLSLLNAPALADGTTLSRSVCAFIAAFWLFRLGVQLFVFDIRPAVQSPLLRLGYHGLTAVFTYFAIVYGAAAAMPWIGGIR